jgi:hypothetical protein
VLSAANNYREWEQGTAMAAEHAAKKPKVMSKKSLKVSADPLGNYGGGILILVRKAYTDLKQIILDEAKERKRRKFIVLGTAGIGKSYFLVFFICYLATQKIKVVWKFSNGDHYLLDFTQDVAEALGPFRDSSTRVLREVFNDLKGWLIIDGQQTTRLPYRCQVLLACCAERDNYYEFSKSDDCKKFYCPVWTEEEIGEFCDDFGEHGSKFSEMWFLGMSLLRIQRKVCNCVMKPWNLWIQRVAFPSTKGIFMWIWPLRIACFTLRQTRRMRP